jgi:hypothetical protein
MIRLDQNRRMARIARNATAIIALVLATVVLQSRVEAAQPSHQAPTTRAELQIGLCAPPDQIERALDLRPNGAPLTVWLFDDAALTLYARGLRLRLRVGADGRSEITLKVADQDCARLDPKVIPPGEGKCEYDVHGASMAGAVSLTRNLSVTKTSDLLAARVAPAQVLSPAQIGYLRDVVAIWPLPPGIRGLGPMHVRKYRTRDGRYDIDISELPGGERYAEISRKVPQADADRALGVLKADLSRAGVEACADQSSQAINKLRSLVR